MAMRLPVPLQNALERGDTVVTPTAQLAVAIRRAWGLFQRGRGRCAWLTPDVIPLQTWLAREWQRARAAGSRISRLLSSVQERSLWDRIVRSDAEDSRYLQPSGLDQSAMRAWRKLHDWAIDPKCLQRGDSEETQSFARWAEKFRERTAAGGWLEAARALWQWPQVVGGAERSGGWVAVGFDGPTPALHMLTRRLQGTGMDARVLELGVTGRKAVRLGLADPDEELRAAASWARDRLSRDPQAHLLIVVPDLHLRRGSVQRIFEEILCPPMLVLEPVAHRVFAIEGGAPLTAYPLVEAALTALELTCTHLPFETVSRWLRSPFLVSAQTESDQRTQLDLKLRRFAPHELNIHELIAGIARADAAGQESFLEGLRRFARQLTDQRAELSRWSEIIEVGLRALGWPGERTLDSAEFQTLEKFHSVLGELATLGAFIGPVDRKGMLRELRRLLSHTLFQPQTEACPVAISSRLADPVLGYDGVWVTGLHASAWPRPARLDPFIPWPEQLQAGVSEATAAGALELANRITSRLLAAGLETVVSWPVRLEEDETLPSPAIASIPEVAFDDFCTPATDYRRMQLGAGSLERITDKRAAAIAVPATVRGGARTLKLQSQCPFRAFAELRLEADVPQIPQPGIDAATRGTLTHRALKLIWNELRSQARLEALTDEQRRNLLDRSVAQAGAEVLESAGRWSGALIGLERIRLFNVLEEFLRLEAQREPFRVLAAEECVSAQVGGLQLKLYIDRIDELSDGRRVVIDYKTGAITPKVWYGERPEDPQLPLYAVVGSPPPAAVAFALVRTGECGWRGAGAEPRALPGLEAKSDWEAQLREWQTTVERLAQQYAAGVADVDPSSRRICDLCHLHALCRIDELDGERIDEDEE